MIALLFLAVYFSGTESVNRIDFLRDFHLRQDKPAAVVSFLGKASPHESLHFCKVLNSNKINCNVQRNVANNRNEDHLLFIADLKEKSTRNILLQAQKEHLLITPRRWLLFFNSTKYFDEQKFEINLPDKIENVQKEESIKIDARDLLENINIAINTEMYIAADYHDEFHVFLVHRRSPNLPLIWENYGIWKQYKGFLNAPPNGTLSMRRRNLQGLLIKTTSVVTSNYSVKHFEDYLHREVDTMTKYTYYMVKHVLEWVNGSGVHNTTDSWGYKQQDGQFNGMMREMIEGRAEIPGSPFVPAVDRMGILEYVAAPAPMEAHFVFRKPALASVTNIFFLPFSRGVWAALLGLIAFSSISLFLTSFREENIEDCNKSVNERISDGILDTLCLVFQQGTGRNPVAISTRQILLLGLMSCMFLFTAYSANVVALLQTTTNEINSVGALLRSPLKFGLQETVYNRYYFTTDTRPDHSELWRRKLLPLGDKAFLSTEEGIRRVRNGMYAFHVESTAGYDQIQRTFLESEKCNIGKVKYIPVQWPYMSVSRNSQIKEQLRIGIHRIMESGLQSRSNRRTLASQPDCGANIAMFAAVSLADVAPAFKCLFIAFGIATMLLIGEIFLNSRIRKR